MSSEDVSIVDVKLELRADSRKRHCRMMIRDSTSDAAREQVATQVRACAMVVCAHAHSSSAQYGRMAGRMEEWKNGSSCRTEVWTGPYRLPYINGVCYS